MGSIRLYSAQQFGKSSELRLQLEGDDNACNVDRADYHFTKVTKGSGQRVLPFTKQRPEVN